VPRELPKVDPSAGLADDAAEVANVKPDLVLDPFTVGILEGLWRRGRLAGDDKAPDVAVHLALAIQHLGREQETEEELVLLEKGAADVCIDVVRKEVVEVLKARGHVRGVGRLPHAGGEQRLEPGEGVLIHGVDVGQIRQTKVDEGGSLRHGAVLFRRCVHLVGRGFSVSHLGRDVVGRVLGSVQRFDEHRVVEDVAL